MYPTKPAEKPALLPSAQLIPKASSSQLNGPSQRARLWLLLVMLLAYAGASVYAMHTAYEMGRTEGTNSGWTRLVPCLSSVDAAMTAMLQMPGEPEQIGSNLSDRLPFPFVLQSSSTTC